MAEKIVHLSRFVKERPPLNPLGLYIRVGHNNHTDLLAAIAEGKDDFFGLVIDAQNVERHLELCTTARVRNLDLVLDTKTLPMSMPGGYTQKLSELPWGLERPHQINDFLGKEGLKRARQIIDFAVDYNFTQILGPTHYLQNSHDRWLNVDTEMIQQVHQYIKELEANIELIYPLAMPMRIMRDPVQRQAIIAEIANIPFDALWLKIDNFGSETTGEKTVSYIEACQDFHSLGKPIVADCVGGLSGLGLLAFSAVGGICHGITILESFKSYSWKNDTKRGKGFMIPPRVYLPQLDMLLKTEEARILINTSTRIKGRLGCRDNHCCPRGIADMLEHPARHFIYQRAEQINALSKIPENFRLGEYLDKFVRRASDEVASMSNNIELNSELSKKLLKKNKGLINYREAMVHFSEKQTYEKTTAILPLRRASRVRK